MGVTTDAKSKDRSSREKSCIRGGSSCVLFVHSARETWALFTGSVAEASLPPLGSPGCAWGPQILLIMCRLGEGVFDQVVTGLAGRSLQTWGLRRFDS